MNIPYKKCKLWRSLIYEFVIFFLMHSLYRSALYHHDFWTYLETNWDNFYWLTGELPFTLQSLVQKLNEIRPISVRGRKPCLSFRNQVLLTVIWIRRYATMTHLSGTFGVPLSCVHRIIHKILRLLHVYAVPKYVIWHNANKWQSLAGYFTHWPRVVAIVDGTPFRISKPKGVMQRLFYRKDRHCFFFKLDSHY